MKMSMKAKSSSSVFITGRWHSSWSWVRKQLGKIVPKGAEKHESTAAKLGTSLSVNTMLLLNASSVKCWKEPIHWLMSMFWEPSENRALLSLFTVSVQSPVQHMISEQCRFQKASTEANIVSKVVLFSLKPGQVHEN